MRPVYYQLLLLNAAILWTHIHVLQPCASLQGLHAMCTCPVHTESSLLHSPGSLQLSERMSVDFYEALGYKVQCLICCEMQQCQEQYPRCLHLNYRSGRRDKWSQGTFPKRPTLVVVEPHIIIKVGLKVRSCLKNKTLFWIYFCTQITAYMCIFSFPVWDTFCST